MNTTSKKLLLIFAAITIIGLSYLFLGRTAKPLVYEESGEVLTERMPADNTTSSPVVTADSDHDGLADWEEIIWKTDPNNPDSDGDKPLMGKR